MRGYAEREVFKPIERKLLQDATRLVLLMPHEFDGEEVRCHELARIVAKVLDLPETFVQDGHFGFVEHTWLWTSEPRPLGDALTRFTLPNVLDVYVPGALPQVQLLYTARSLPMNYRFEVVREDIRWNVVEHFVRELRA